MATLVYSLKCQNCKIVVDFIKEHQELQSIITYHNIDDGIPDYIKSVPSLVTNDNKMLVGKNAIIDLFKTMVKKEPIGYSYKSMYSAALAKPRKPPEMSEEFKRKIETDPSELLKQLKR